MRQFAGKGIRELLRRLNEEPESIATRDLTVGVGIALDKIAKWEEEGGGEQGVPAHVAELPTALGTRAGTRAKIEVAARVTVGSDDPGSARSDQAAREVQPLDTGGPKSRPQPTRADSRPGLLGEQHPDRRRERTRDPRLGNDLGSAPVPLLSQVVTRIRAVGGPPNLGRRWRFVAESEGSPHDPPHLPHSRARREHGLCGPRPGPVDHKLDRTARAKRGASLIATVALPSAPKATPHAKTGRSASVVADQ
jgi:hypothetical protein